MNKTVLMGRLTADTELRTTGSGKSVTTFTLAVPRRLSKEDKADFINCVAWGSTAEFINRYFGKGKMIAVIGEIQSRNYEDKNGNKRTAIEVNVNEVYFCGKEEQKETVYDGGQPTYTVIDDDGDLPF